jgi:hypothetical protein
MIYLRVTEAYEGCAISTATECTTNGMRECVACVIGTRKTIRSSSALRRGGVTRPADVAQHLGRPVAY